MPIILFIFAAFTNSNFYIMQLEDFVKLTISHLKFLEAVCSTQMKLHEDSVLNSEEDLLNYDSLGFVLASIRDILKQF